MYFIDANVFLELQLQQKNADDCEELLKNVMSGKITAITTDFLVDAIIIVMENYGKSPDEIRLFISSLIGFKHLHIYRLTLIDRIAATTHMKQFGLDFDDSTAYQAMKVMNIKKIITYDRHFDAIPDVQRVLPEDII